MAENASFKKRSYLKGRLKAPGDKSITHRALIFSALTKGRRTIENALLSEDTESTIACLKSFGLSIYKGETSLVVESPGAIIDSLLTGQLSSQTVGAKEFYCGNSGTTMRIMSGLSAALPGLEAKFSGDESLSRRDMQRVLTPLQAMGCRLEYLSSAGRAPFKIVGERIHGGDFALPVSSAQVSTAIILAGLLAQGGTSVSTPYMVRDHSLRALKYLGAPVRSGQSNQSNTVFVEPLTENLPALPVQVAGDISSAAFMLVAAAILPGSQIEITEVGLNPGRTLVLEVLREMGAHIEIRNERELCGEPLGDIFIESDGNLKACRIGVEDVARGIDEIPILALAAAFANGTSIMDGLGELAAKESNRLLAMAENLRGLGVEAVVRGDSLKISGRESLSDIAYALPFQWRAHNDHRIAMAGHIAGLCLGSKVIVDDSTSIAVSYPGFFKDVDKLLQGAR